MTISLWCFARCISRALICTSKKVRELADHDLSGTTQDLSIGTEYKAHQKGFLAEWKVAVQFRGALFVSSSEAGSNPSRLVRPLHPVNRKGEAQE